MCALPSWLMCQPFSAGFGAPSIVLSQCLLSAHRVKGVQVMLDVPAEAILLPHFVAVLWFQPGWKLGPCKQG